MDHINDILTAVRGKVRRLSKGVEKERHSTTAVQLDGMQTATGEEATVLRWLTARQSALNAGLPLPVMGRVEENAPHVWETLQAARRSQH